MRRTGGRSCRPACGAPVPSGRGRATDAGASAGPEATTTSRSVQFCAFSFLSGLIWAFSCAKLPNCVRPYERSRQERDHRDEERGGVMIVGVPKEIKNEEYRVAVTPKGVKEFVRAGHTVIVEKA